MSVTRIRIKLKAAISRLQLKNEIFPLHCAQGHNDININRMATSSVLRASYQSGSALHEDKSPLLQETEFRLPWLVASMVERVLRTTRDSNTSLCHNRKNGLPILQVPFRMA